MTGHQEDGGGSPGVLQPVNGRATWACLLTPSPGVVSVADLRPLLILRAGCVWAVVAHGCRGCRGGSPPAQGDFPSHDAPKDQGTPIITLENNHITTLLTPSASFHFSQAT